MFFSQVRLRCFFLEALEVCAKFFLYSNCAFELRSKLCLEVLHFSFDTHDSLREYKISIPLWLRHEWDHQELLHQLFRLLKYAVIHV